MRVLLLATAVLALGGCGFQLQGRTSLPGQLAVTHVASEDEQSDFVQDLRRALLASGARLTPRAQDATAVVRVLQDQVSQSVLSVSARNIPREYRINHTVRFAVQAAGGRELLPPQEVTLSRDYSFDERLLLAKEREEEILREALARDLVGIVMRQLSSL